jgi:hypothetical protein
MINKLNEKDNRDKEEVLSQNSPNLNATMHSFYKETNEHLEKQPLEENNDNQNDNQTKIASKKI